MFESVKKSMQYKRCYKHQSWNRADRKVYALVERYLDKSEHGLEMGSATGHVSFRLAQNGYRIDLLDVREDAIRTAKENYKSANLEAKFYVEDIFDHRVNYDLIWNTGLLQCYPYPIDPHWTRIPQGEPDQQTLIRHLSRITKKLLVFCPDTDNCEVVRHTTGSGLRGVGNCKTYTVQHITKLLRDNFLAVDEGTFPGKTGAGKSFDWIWWCARHDA